MESTKILSGQSSFDAKGFAQATMLNVLSFAMQGAMFASQKADTPTFDAALAEAMGDNGLPTPTKLNLEEITQASAACFILLSRHVQKPNPENGRKPEHLIRFLAKADPKAVIQAAVDYRLKRGEAQTAATAAMLNADPTKRIEALRKEINAQADIQKEPVRKAWLAAIKAQSALDDEELINVVVEAVKNTGRSPEQELKRAAAAFLDAQTKRFEAGDFVVVDGGIYAMAGRKAPQVPAASPTTEAAPEVTA